MKKAIKLTVQTTRNTNNLKRTLFTLATFALFAFALGSAAVTTADAATLIVNTTADNAAFTTCTTAAGGCPLRGAIAAAISGDTIIFDSTVFASAQIIKLSGTELDIGKNLTITGTGANLLTIDADFVSRIFSVTNPFTVILENMTITNGRRIATSGSTILRRGGAIYNSSGGKITLNNMIVSGNQANLSGGAIFTTGTVSVINVNNSTISGNTAGGGGGGIEQSNGTVNISNSFITGNTAVIGGGIDSTAAAPITVTNSTISGNSATTGYGGGISKNYSASNTGYSLIIKNSTISNNASNTNAVAGNLDVGGGIFILTNGADNTSQTLIQNSTVSGNSSRNFGGGGIFIQGSGVDFINSTVTNNTSNSASGGGIFSSDSLGTAKLLNTIVAGNTAAANPDTYASPDNGGGSGIFVSYGNNLIGNQGSAAFPAASGDQIGTDMTPLNARLQPLGNYGGATQTHALLSTSPAKDAGNNCVTTSTCTGINPMGNLTADQRGAPRIGNVDIGAFEYNQPTAASVTVSGRAMTTRGRGIANVRITMTDAGGNVRTAITSSFGFYRFTAVAAGDTYIFSASGRRYTFVQPSRVLNINEDTDAVNFVGDSSLGNLSGFGN